VGPSQRAENMQRMKKESTYTTFSHMMTSSSFDFRVYLKNIFALEPLVKLATFVVEEVISQKKKKVKKIIPHRCYRSRRKRALKPKKFSKYIFFTYKIYKKYVQGFFRIQRHQMIILETKLCFLLNFKYRK
jgi:hypothetical protein